MRVGYLPDMFGHVAQMPQILRAAGIETAVVWRGVPGRGRLPPLRLGRDRRLRGGRGVPARRIRQRRVHLRRPGPGRSRAVRGALPSLVRERSRARDGRNRPHAARARLLGACPDGATRRHARRSTSRTPRRTGSSHWRGELRSAARANLLPGRRLRPNRPQGGVRACGTVARALRRAACRRSTADDWPEPFLAQAWTRMFQNSAHDSICGCSADEVSAQVLVRYAEAEQIGRELAQRARCADRRGGSPRRLRGRESVAARAHRPRRAGRRRPGRVGGGRAGASGRHAPADAGDTPPGAARCGRRSSPARRWPR